MALWSIWSAPLMMGNDLRSLSQESKAILLNEKLLSINRDPLGVWALKVHQLDTEDGSLQVFVKPIMPVNAKTGCPSFAVLYFSRRIIGHEWPVSSRFLLYLRSLQSRKELRKSFLNTILRLAISI